MNKIAKQTAFLFMWCSVKHLEDARALFRKWGFRRVEDICWLKTNHNKARTLGTHASLVHRVSEHCLMGIRGGVKRSSDSHMVHSNIDTGILVRRSMRCSYSFFFLNFASPARPLAQGKG